MKKIISQLSKALFAVLAFLLPASAQAQIIPACALGDGGCTSCDFVALFVNIAGFFLSIIGGIVVLMFVIGGFFFIISGGSSDRVNKGKSIITGAIIGLALVLGAWLIINFSIAAALGETDFSKVKILGNEWSSYCANVKVSDAASSCNDENQGETCATNGCSDALKCVCSGSQCVSICEYYDNIEGLTASCEADEADCEADEYPQPNSCTSESKSVCCLKSD